MLMVINDDDGDINKLAPPHIVPQGLSARVGPRNDNVDDDDTDDNYDHNNGNNDDDDNNNN